MFNKYRLFDLERNNLPQIGKTVYRAFLLFAVFAVIFDQMAMAREQWQIDRPNPPPMIPKSWNPNAIQPEQKPFHPVTSNSSPISQHGSVPGKPGAFMGNHHIRSILGSRIPVGSVLTGVMETELSSEKSQAGDIFAIILDHGFSANNIQIVPPGSKIIGTVVSASSSGNYRNGMPGQLTVGLQSLVFPDGRTTKFTGFIDQNPAHEQEEEVQTRNAGLNLGDYGKQIKGMLGSFAGGIGWVHQSRMKGKELKIDQGKHVAVKVNQTINLATMTPPLGSNFVPGLTSSTPPVSANPMVPGMTQPQVPGLSPTRPAMSTPGLVGPDPNAHLYHRYSGVRPAPPRQAAALPQLKATQQKLNIDPNQIFNHPIDKPLNSLSDPF